MARNRQAPNFTAKRPLLAAIAMTGVAIVAAVLLLVVHRASTTLSTVSVIHSPAAPATTAATVAATTTTAATATATATTTTHPTTTTPPGPPHFATPQAAMSYMAAAWNSGNTVALDHVTNPAARAELVAMHSEAVNLRLDHCTPRPQGDYLCYFDHDYQAGTATTLPGGQGLMTVLVGPADTPGWYMTVFLSCG